MLYRIYILCLIFFLLMGSYVCKNAQSQSVSYTKPITFDEVKAYFDHQVVVHDSGNPSIKIKPFDYLTINILPLWSKLGINWQKIAEQRKLETVFNCKKSDTKCFVDNPELSFLTRNKIKIIDITNNYGWDHQYLIFKNDIYLGHFELSMQKYDNPKLAFLDDDLFSIKVLYGSGSDIIDYRTDYYQINDKHGLKKVLTTTDRYERYGWGAPFDIKISSKSSYAKGLLKVKYQIKVMETLEGKLIVKDNRTILYKKVEKGLSVDLKNSNITPEVLANLDAKPKALYLMYKSKFDHLKNGSKETHHWYEEFQRYIKQ